MELNVRNFLASSATSGGMNLLSVLSSYFTGQSVTSSAPLIGVSPQISNMIVALLGKASPVLAALPTSLLNTVISFVIGWILLGLIIWAGLRLLGTWIVAGVCVLLGAGGLFALIMFGVIKL